MRKKTILWQKKGEFLKPAHYAEWNEFQKNIKNSEWVQAVFSKPIQPKTHKQLKYLYGIVYPHLIAWYNDTQTFLYEIKLGNEIIEVEGNTDTADLFFKKLFCIHKGITKFQKENSDIEQMIEYINFLDKLSIDNFGVHLPDPKKQQEEL